MHIAMLVFNQPERGTYWRAYYFARELCRRGHHATLIATAPRERTRFRVAYEQGGRLALVDAPDMLPGSLRSGWDLWASLARATWLRLARIDLIHAFECRPSVILPALAARRRTGTPLVIDWCDLFGRGGSVEQRPSWLTRTALRPIETFFETRFRTEANATTVINRYLGQRAADLGVDPATITLVPNGCDTAGWALEPQSQARSALGLPPGAPLIGYVGAIFRHDANLLARAFDQLRARRPDAQLIVIGYCNIPIERLVGEPTAVLRTGPLDTPTLRRYLRACTLGWLPLGDSGANRGRWPLKLSTYMEAGLPFVTTSIGDLGDFVRRYPAGLAADPTPASIAAQTLALLDDPPLAADLGATGRRLAETELSWAHVADMVEGVYQSALSGERQPSAHSADR